MQVAQTEGVGLYYSESIYGVPPVLIQHLQKFPVLHEVNILITNRAVPVPDVLHKERILVETLGLPGFYHCICRLTADAFVSGVLASCSSFRVIDFICSDNTAVLTMQPVTQCITPSVYAKQFVDVKPIMQILRPGPSCTLSSFFHDCRYGYTEVPDQGHAFVETLLLTMLKKLYNELHTVIQNSEEDLCKAFPALAQGDLPQISAVAAPSSSGSGATVLGPVQPPSPDAQAKPLIQKILQMTGTKA